ncbi:hypothetical protein BB558_002963 [Smittium angustum]|uniref:Major facilitator superfamily (MFS) profile domain-containing protein n=1 Tax=Smittium angustum TaxID=133377 RepID=A0A2U1J7B2_SMIAN|nr:hypothetical protein BB558_002963 [Smittium angustum]
MAENTSTINKPENNIPIIQLEPPQDEGYAWIVLISSFICSMFSRGSFASFSVFQTYYLKVMFVNEPADKIAWISTCCTSMIFGGGIFASKIVRRIGMRNTNLLASFIALTGLILASFSTQIWQLVLTQGIIFGFGSSIYVNTNTSILTMWFNKHRGLVMGITASGSVLGGIILIPLVNKLIDVGSISWAFRVYGIMFFVCTSICAILLKPRIPYKPLDKVIDIKLLKDPIALPLSFGGFFIQAAIYVLVLYFPSSMMDNTGISRNTATNLYMIYNLSSFIGRIISGIISKRFDPSMIIILDHFLSAVLMMTMWFATKNLTVYIAFMSIFGITATPYFALSPFFKNWDTELRINK